MNSTDPTAILRNLSLQALQGLNAEIYLVVNDQHFDAGTMANRLLRYSTKVLKMVRKKEGTANAGYYLVMAMSWSFAIANRLHVNLGDNLWARYPGICHSCQQGKCYCKAQSTGAYRVTTLPKVNQPPQSIGEWKKMFEGIFPDNNLEDVVMHLAEEIGELIEALEHLRNTHESHCFREATEALSDTVALIFAVATCFKIDFGAEFERNFENGCPKCGRLNCGCGFSTAKMV